MMKYPNAANPNYDVNFPYFVRHAEGENFLPRGINFGVLHWHDDLQFIYVLEGKVCVRTLEAEEIISAGEAAFVNKKVVHYSIGRTKNCRYELFRFPENFVTFYMGSPAERLTKRLTEDPQNESIIFRPGEAWCDQVLGLLQELVCLENEKNEMYPYKVLVTASRIWALMLENVEVSVAASHDRTSMRMRAFLQYIEDCYMNDVTLDELAASANVSKSEVLRCFRQTLQTTPYRYLMNYRLSKAEALLAETELPIGEIAGKTGFNQQSYFGKCFREQTGMSPREYRKLHKKQRLEK